QRRAQIAFPSSAPLFTPVRVFFFLILPRPPTSTLFPYTTLFRSRAGPRENRRERKDRPTRVPTCCAAPRFRIDEHRHSSHDRPRSEEHTSELQSRGHLVCRLLLEKKNKI